MEVIIEILILYFLPWSSPSPNIFWHLSLNPKLLEPLNEHLMQLGVVLWFSNISKHGTRNGC